MGIVAGLIAVFKGLAAIPAILGYVKEFAAAICLWYMQNATKETLSMISDAAAAAQMAETDEEKDAANEKWAKALSRTRYIS